MLVDGITDCNISQGADPEAGRKSPTLPSHRKSCSFGTRVKWGLDREEILPGILQTEFSGVWEASMTRGTAQEKRLLSGIVVSLPGNGSEGTLETEVM
jgi:hypothetical protein